MSMAASGRQDGERKPRQPYSPEERSEREERLVAALAMTEDSEHPSGNLLQAALLADTPRATAHRWMAMDDEGFRQARGRFKRAFHGAGLDLIARADHALRLKLDLLAEDPDALAKADVRSLAIAYGTLYDKAALAAGEQQGGLTVAVHVDIDQAAQRGRTMRIDGADAVDATWETVR